jgi:hypothetical protein
MDDDTGYHSRHADSFNESYYIRIKDCCNSSFVTARDAEGSSGRISSPGAAAGALGVFAAQKGTQYDYSLLFDTRDGVAMNKSLAARYYKPADVLLNTGSGIPRNASLPAHYSKLSLIKNMQMVGSILLSVWQMGSQFRQTNHQQRTMRNCRPIKGIHFLNSTMRSFTPAGSRRTNHSLGTITNCPLIKGMSMSQCTVFQIGDGPEFAAARYNYAVLLEAGNSVAMDKALTTH